MDARGPGAYKRWLNHCSSEYAEMIDGPPVPLTNEKVKEVRRHWRDGGRELIMRDWKVPGVRPFGFWPCDIAAPDRRRAMKMCATEAEMVLLLDLAEEAERQAIADGDVIAKQRAAGQ